MAVQAHAHYHHLHHHQGSPFIARGGGPESSRAAAAMELPQAQKEAMAPVHPSPLFLEFSYGDCGGGRKRQREDDAAAMAAMAAQQFSLQPQAQGPKVISLAQLHKRPATGLRLDFDEGSEQVPSTSSASCLLSDELAAQRGQHKGEMDRLIQEHAEKLRRAMADMRLRHYRSLVCAAEAAAARRLREKEAEVSEAARRGAELEERVARLRAEAAAWQAKALADQSTAAALHAQLQQAAAAAQARCKAEDDNAAGAADDAESCFVDPDKVEEVAAPPPPATCRACGLRAASVVLLPCRHLCACAACEPAVTSTVAFAGVAPACPMCRGAVTGSVQVLFS